VAREVGWRRDVWGRLLALRAVSIAAVHGYAVGGGFEMALLCDLCVAADDARFALPETGLGMIPGVGGTQTLPRRVGLARALDVVLTGRHLDARAASMNTISFLSIPAGIVPEQEAVVCEGTRFSYAETLSRTRRLSGALAHLGVGCGTRVAALGVNSHRSVEAYYATALLGGVFI